MRAQEFVEADLGTKPRRAARKGSRPPRGHEPVPRYRRVGYCDACDRVEDECICDKEKLDELMFMNMSPCKTDCSGHRAGYKWSKERGGVSTASWSDSFNRGAEIAKAGY
jgi:hypothetical protein